MKKNLTILLALIVLGLSSPLNLLSQITARSFTLAYSENLKGGINTFGNTMMHAVSNGVVDSLAMNESGNPNNTSGGLGFSAFSNDNQEMVQIDIDNLSSTFNSSSADLILPAGGNTIKFARLYWSARIDASTVRVSADTIRKVLLRKAGNNSYLNITAQDTIIIRSQLDTSTYVYRSYADITDYIKTNGQGTYFVANLPLSERDVQGGQYGGWAISVVYENPTEFYNSLRIYDGFAQVYNAGNAGSINITLTDLNVPNTVLQSNEAIMGSVVWEGDAGLTGDYLRLNNISVSNNINASNNFFNGSISKRGTFVSSKSPDYFNQMGVDIDELEVGTGYNILPNATTAKITFGTTADQYFPSVLTFVIRVKDPLIELTKTVTDANNSGFVDADETLTYVMTGTNQGLDTLFNTVLIDTLPLNATYVPGSMVIILAPGMTPGSRTDLAADDEASVVVSGGRTILKSNLGIESGVNQGGKIPPGETYAFRFKMKSQSPPLAVINKADISGESGTGVPNADWDTAAIFVNVGTGTSINIAACDSFSWNNSSYAQSGTYFYSYINANGIPSTDTLFLTINYSNSSNSNITVCENQLPYSWNGLTFTQAGTQSVTLSNVAGCDSIATLNLSVRYNSASTTDISICENQLPYAWNGLNFTQAGTQSATLSSAAGCDSIATLNLSVRYNSASTTDISICENELPYAWNGLTFTQAGTQSVTLSNVAGCDSIATLNLFVKSNSSSTTDVSVCENELPYAWNGLTFTQAGTQSATLSNAAGCDSIATLNLFVKSNSSSTTDVSVCENELPYVWNGLSFTQAGTQSATLSNTAGCDSIATLNLSVRYNSASTTDVSVCENELPYAWNGLSFTQAGTQSVTLSNAAGCDSIATLNLSVRYNSASTTDISICENELPYSWNGLTFTQAGTQSATLSNAAGCDSVVTLNLFVNLTDRQHIDTSVCEKYLPFEWNGKQYFNTTVDTFVYKNRLGCDSIISLRLVVINCDPPCRVASFSANADGWRLSQGARIFNYSNPVNNCNNDRGILTPGVGGNDPANIRTADYISSGAKRININFDIFCFNANMKCNTWKDYDCATSIDVFYYVNGTRYAGVIDFVLPPNGPGNSPMVDVIFPVGNNLPEGAVYSIELRFKFKSGVGNCVQQNTKYVIDNFGICEKQGPVDAGAPVPNGARSLQELFSLN
jgi:uncharacterized repeat protein (TIGR01451 family)